MKKSSSKLLISSFLIDFSKKISIRLFSKGLDRALDKNEFKIRVNIFSN